MTTYRDLSKKSAKELRDVCREQNISDRGRKVEVLSRLVDHFDIEQSVADNSTVLGQSVSRRLLESYRSLPKFHRIATGWTKDIRKVPDFDLGKLKTYLIESNNKSYDCGSLRAYKALQAYRHYWAGHVHSMEFNEYPSNEDFCFVKGKCNPSQDSSGKQYVVYLCLRQSGEVLGAHCQCVAGLGEACTHAAAVMFALEDFVAKGYKCLPDGKTCTDLLCYWTSVRNTNVVPRPVSEIDFSNPVFGKVKQNGPSSESTCIPKPHSVLRTKRRPKEAEKYKLRVQELLYKLEECIPSCDFLSHCTLPLSPVPPEVDHEEEVTTTPFPSASFQNVTPTVVNSDILQGFAGVNKSLQVTKEKQVEIERMTQGQADNPMWFECKLGRITASICKDVATFGTRTQNPERLINKIMQKCKSVRTEAMSYGIKFESCAVHKYEALNGVQTTESGLVVDLHNGEIACSPDRFVSDKTTGEPGLVEVKCLFSCKDLTVQEAVKEKGQKYDFPFYLKDSKMYLKEKHKYYYQVQMQLGITNRQWCDVVIFTNENCDIGIVRTEFNKDFWDEVKCKLLEFHSRHIKPLL